ncbi:MAG: anhydro-N-acetylmuramic acid kinase [Gammaproteobacteria bacterium]
MRDLFIGLMSGTSVDGIDAALVDFTDDRPKFIGHSYTQYTADFRQRILDLCQPSFDEVNRLGELDVMLGYQFATAANLLLAQTKVNPAAIRAIGSHGQTIRHHPARGFTLQIGDPNTIAAETGITTVADFRRRDVAYGGQGAPLVPGFHQSNFSDAHENRVVLNIGGIANITLLPADKTTLVFGFDTGPGNTLLDAWAEKHLNQPRDDDGAWGSKGVVHADLLRHLLDDDFFKLPAPKSTGREYFNLSWLAKFSLASIKPIDVQATLVELTAQSIIDSIQSHFDSGKILICGGGIHNLFLLKRLREIGKKYSIESTQQFGINPDCVEAVAFAWLAKQTLAGKPGNITTVTGAKQASILGGVYYA